MQSPESRCVTRLSTTIAPTGTISIICGTSSGIEPVFAISYIRNVMDKDHLVEVLPYFEKTAKEKGYYSKALMEKIAKQGGLHGLDEVPKEDKKIFVCAHDVSPHYHIKMQAAFQEATDNAVSKTVELPENRNAGRLCAKFMNWLINWALRALQYIAMAAVKRRC